MLQGKKKTKQKKKVTAVAVAFFMKLRCNATSKEEEEGDGNNAAITYFVVLRCNAAPQQEEEGDDSCCRLLCGVALQLHNRKKKATVLRGATLQRNFTTGRRRQRQLPSHSLWSCTVATQEEEEGDDNCRCLFCGVALQLCSKTRVAVQRCLLRYATLQSAAYLVELQCKAAPQTNKQTK
jgi:hypothetical protein